MKRRQKRKLIVLGILAFLLLLGVFFRSDIEDSVKGWRFGTMVEKAGVAAEEGRVFEAQRFASSAWKLSGTRIERLRMLAELGKVLDWPGERVFMEQLFYAQGAELDDQLLVLRYFLNQGDLMFVMRLLEGMPEERRGAPLIMLCEADALSEHGRHLEAVELAKRVLSTENGHEARLVLSRLLPELPSNELAWRQCAAYVAELMLNGPEVLAMQGFRNLKELAPKYRVLPGIDSALVWLEERSGVTVQDRFLATEIDTLGTPSDRKLTVVKQLVHDEMGENGGAVGRWLLETNQRNMLLELPEEVAMGDIKLYIARLQAYVDEGMEQEALSWMARAPQGVSLTILEGVKAGLARRSGDEFARVVAWGKAFDMAARMEQYGDYLAILLMAEHFKDEKVVRRAAKAISELPTQHLPDAGELLFLKEHFGHDPAFLRELFGKLLATSPQNVVLRHEHARLGMLLNDDEEEWRTELTEMAQHFTQVLPIQCSYVLALLDAGEASLALKHLEAQNTNWNEAAGALEKATYAMALRANGKSEKALSLERGIVWDDVPAYEGFFFHEGGVSVPRALWEGMEKASNSEESNKDSTDE